MKKVREKGIMCSINFTQLSDDTMWSVVPSFDSDKHPETEVLEVVD